MQQEAPGVAHAQEAAAIIFIFSLFSSGKPMQKSKHAVELGNPTACQSIGTGVVISTRSFANL
jgi:hypothetical protein